MPESAASANRMSAAQRREQLLDTVKDIVAREGFHGVSIEAVAREAGISRPIVYGHFHDLQGLIEALIEREGARARAQLAGFLPTGMASGEPGGLLLSSLRAYLEAAQADPVTWRLVLATPEGAPPVLRERITEGRTAVVAVLAEAIAAMFPGEHASPDPELTARTLSVVADEAVRLSLEDPEGYPAERLVEHARWLLRALLPPELA